MSATVLISYAWENEDHKEWVRGLAERLRNDGVDVLLDRWAVPPGGDLAQFMETAVARSKYVLLICTPTYKLKSDGRAGGVGYEGAVITGEIFTGTPTTKFIPILRSGEWKDAGPARLLSSRYVDLSTEELNQSEYSELLDLLLDPRQLPHRSPTGAQKRDTQLVKMLLHVLEELQGRVKPLSASIATAYRIATEHGLTDLQAFCARELGGS